MSPIEKKHREMVAGLVKSPKIILSDLDHDKTDMLHATLGIAGEAGEIVDSVKKHAIYGIPLHEHNPKTNQTLHENLVEELGDMEFFLEQLRHRIGVSREDTLLNNYLKLSKRYENGYSDQAAKERADKA